MRGRFLFIALLWWCCRCGAVAGADDPVFLGPVPARNFHPIQLIFLNLPFETAAVLDEGAVAVLINSAESNEIATARGPVDAVLKFESNRTVLGARYGLAREWEVGVDVPFLSRFGGFMDPIIDEVEHVTDMENSARRLYPHNTFGDFYVRRQGTTLFEGRAQSLELGDVSLSAKHAMALGDGWPLVAVRGAVKFPTGRAGGVFGSGKTDVGFGVAADWRALDPLMLYGNLNLIFPGGPITPARLTLNPILTQSCAAEWALTQRFSALLHQAAYTSPMHGTGVGVLDGTEVEIGLGLNFAWSRVVGFQFLAIDNVSPVEHGADATIMLATVMRP